MTVKPRNPRPLPLDEFARFNRELSALVRSRLPLAEGLRSLGRDDRPAGRLGTLACGIAESLERGRPLSKALEESGHAFPRLYLEMVRAGERSESLATILSAIARSSARELEMRTTLRSMAMYPASILLLCLAIGGGILLWVVPVFSETYEMMNAKLPPTTLALLTIAGFVESHFLWVLPGFALAAGAGVLLVRWRRWTSPILYRLPILGEMLSLHHTSMWCRALGELTDRGVPLDESLNLAAEVVPSTVLGRFSREAAVNVQRGGRMVQSSEQVLAIPASFLWLLSRGEELGELPDVFRDLADLAEEKLVVHRQRAMSVFEPLLLVVIGLLVGFLIVALYHPIFKIHGVL